MRIINLIENTEGERKVSFAHGLSFYIEIKEHKILLDFGPSGEIKENAKKLGVNLAEIDTAVLSHGHYDHSGGLLTFAEINNKAAIYMQKTATGEYYSDDGRLAEGERFRYIGIDKEIEKLKNVHYVEGDYDIDDELKLLTVKKRSHKLPFTNKRILMKKDGQLVGDEFTHEHSLVIASEGKNILMSGCAHNGILSILDSYKEKYKSEPDLVISGFHLMKKTEYREDQKMEIEEIARELATYKNTKFITCHCTGVLAYEIMKKIMGEKLGYVHSGDEIEL
ncbi:MAG: MBL fold metallo-hydrolase [Lachnospiraceae bacterium]|nr:MBL fold metallo-hydrolase [Lachnospiraceae bacterium]